MDRVMAVLNGSGHPVKFTGATTDVLRGPLNG